LFLVVVLVVHVVFFVLLCGVVVLGGVVVCSAVDCHNCCHVPCVVWAMHIFAVCVRSEPHAFLSLAQASDVLTGIQAVPYKGVVDRLVVLLSVVFVVRIVC